MVKEFASKGGIKLLITLMFYNTSKSGDHFQRFIICKDIKVWNLKVTPNIKGQKQRGMKIF